jgi:hypothetical protein
MSDTVWVGLDGGALWSTAKRQQHRAGNNQEESGAFEKKAQHFFSVAVALIMPAPFGKARSESDAKRTDRNQSD